jgi:hypothetical protein
MSDRLTYERPVLRQLGPLGRHTLGGGGTGFDDDGQKTAAKKGMAPKV